LAANFESRALMKIRHCLHTRKLLLLSAGLLLTAWLAPPYFHAGRYRRLLQAGLENKLGRPVELGAVSFRLLAHPGFSIDHVVIKEDPRFGSEPFARVGRVECDLRWRSLWGSRLDCARILLEHPILNLVRNGRGEWNIQDFFLRSNTVTRIRSTHGAASFPAGFDLDIEDARLNFTVGITKRPFTVTGFSGGLTLDPSSGLIRFDFAGTPVRPELPQPPPGPVELSGEWKPGKNLQGSLQATLHTSSSLLYGWIPLLTSRNPEVYGLVDATVQMAGSINRLGVTGDIRVHQLHRCDSLPPSSSMPVGISFKGSLDRTRQQFFIQHGDVSFGNSRFHLTGAIDRISVSPELDLVVAVQKSQLQDILGMEGRLSGHRAAWDASGRVDGLLTVQGPWRQRRYGGFISAHSIRLQAPAVSFSIPEAAVRIDRHGARLLPVRFSPARRVECMAEGVLFPALPASRAARVSKGRDAPALLSGVTAGPRPRGRVSSSSAAQPLSRDRYEVTVSTQQAPVHELLRLARSFRVFKARDIDAEGLANATLRLSGRAWPFGKPAVSAYADLDRSRLLIPGLTEPVRLTRFHLEARGQDIQVDPLVAGMGPVSFSGWLKHEGGRANPWRFDLGAPKLSMEQASLWFAVLGHKEPLPILDLIPGLRSLVARRTAGRSIFASVHARGRLESRLVTFRSVHLKNVRARISIADRVATVENVAFRVAGGAGGGSARIDFKRVPALLTGKFQLNGGELASIAWRLPPALRGIRGRIAATGHFTTRGLTRQEMSAGFSGEAGLQLTDVSLGTFDPLRAFARAAALGSFRANPGAARFRFAALKLQIRGERAILAPFQLRFGRALFDIDGDYGFNGKADVYVRSDLSNLRRHRVRGMQSPFAPQELALSAPPGEDPMPTALLPSHRPTQTTEIRRSEQSLPSPAGLKSYLAAIHLAGNVNDLEVVKGAANARP
jgi:hypothetical protein